MSISINSAKNFKSLHTALSWITNTKLWYHLSNLMDSENGWSAVKFLYKYNKHWENRLILDLSKKFN